MLGIGIFDKFRLCGEGISLFVDRLDGMHVVLEAGNSSDLWRKLEAAQMDLLLRGIYQSSQGNWIPQGRYGRDIRALKFLSYPTLMKTRRGSVLSTTVYTGLYSGRVTLRDWKMPFEFSVILAHPGQSAVIPKSISEYTCCFSVQNPTI